jgi:pimeloyl-ACP methyl ester carboxylesterase
VTGAGAVTVDGCEIRWSAAGSGGPALVFVHGGAAHAAWWEPVLRRLDGRRLVTLDLSGHGDSGRRDAYAITTWAAEVAGVIGAAADGRAVVVGHSLGGRVGCVTAARHPEAVEALVLLDSAVPVPADDPVPPVRPARVYDSRDRAMRAFRLLPDQPAPPAPIMEHVARTSIVERSDGWTWKFDPSVFADLGDEVLERHLPGIRCPVVAVQGERSAITGPALVEALAAHVGRPVPLVTIPAAHHHVILDSPAEVAAILDWLPETRRSPAAG